MIHQYDHIWKLNTAEEKNKQKINESWAEIFDTYKIYKNKTQYKELLHIRVKGEKRL